MRHDFDSSLVQAETLGKCWLGCVARVLQQGKLEHDEDVGIHEILGLSISISKPRTDDPLIAGLGDRSVIERTLAKFAKGIDMPDRPFTYSARIYDHYGTDQFEWLVQRLRGKREAKSATICLLTAGSGSKNLPCLTTLDAKIRDEKLELQFFFRSQNVFGRQYANFLALAKFQADLAARCGVAPGGMHGYIASAHIYAFDVDEAKRIVSGEHLNIEDKYYTEGPDSGKL